VRFLAAVVRVESAAKGFMCLTFVLAVIDCGFIIVAVATCGRNQSNASGNHTVSDQVVNEVRRHRFLVVVCALCA
jgi:hypothetical protein